ncbi:hypothetical protein E5676_scaffold302G002070 [Cucumis melo var. makuwa]|uniref:Uncharacterized protein n=1 Tax=Cucumis melo var. makuwa TaxID=1194695 RepID=A0A5D3CQ19_CUCMM|nr:hypothetical protein E6C27_scaffold24G001170 [Cucumis melo var. makuwa]TYK12419.1 hypothetical protein E5676_scaffold302G002070 [Cucumis melo var. makuwa]
MGSYVARTPTTAMVSLGRKQAVAQFSITTIFRYFACFYQIQRSLRAMIYFTGEVSSSSPGWPEETFARLRYLLGGLRPIETVYLRLSLGP